MDSLYTVHVTSTQYIAQDTLEVRFSKPDGFIYFAGQFVQIWLDIDANDRKSNVRSMSLASAPYEQNLAVCMRMTDSAWKQKIASLKIGDSFQITQAKGKLMLSSDEQTQSTVFLAGGIGIVPFYALIKQDVFEKSSRPKTLFYFNRHQEDIAYYNELLKMQSGSLQVIFSLTTKIPTETESVWTGETGYFTQQLLTKYFPDYQNAIFCIVGTPEMVKSTKETLLALGLSAESVRQELFTGYAPKIPPAMV